MGFFSDISFFGGLPAPRLTLFLSILNFMKRLYV